MRAVLVILLMLAGLPAVAGPWPRDRGAVFLSFGGLASPQRGEVLAYGEYGLGRGWTIGFDGAVGRFGGGRGMLLASRALSRPDAANRLSLELGMGSYVQPGGRADTVLRGGLAFGRGFDGRLPGWMRLDVLGEWRGGAAAVKADAMVGVRPTERIKAMVQFQGDWSTGGGTLVAVPSVAWQVRRGLEVELGGRIGILGPSETGLRLVTWISF
ncbi:MAG: hypothetical protein ACK4TB_17260 [Gemmobacter sp.]